MTTFNGCYREKKFPFVRYFKKAAAAFLLGLMIPVAYADQELISVFPLDRYDQSVSTWIKPNNADFDAPLMTVKMQQQRMDIFYDHYFGSLSPWNADYVNRILRLSAPDDLKTNERRLINTFNNEGKSDNDIGYGENFRPHTQQWIANITDNINLNQFDGLTYQANRRGIAVDNLHVRILPTDDVHFYNHQVAGQGYPFDNLQMSALWVGTPVYILAESRDHAWLLVITPDFIGWVKHQGIARVDTAFVQTWTKAAKTQLTAITKTQTSLLDDQAQYLLTAYVGAVFPGVSTVEGIQMMVPVANQDKQAVIKQITVTTDQAALMPMAVTPHHFATLMSSMAGRPYGWGSMYFYNDCSAETKSLLTPFGIWLPRHSSDQVTVGKMVDMTAASPEKRLAYLQENGEKFLTLVYIGGHVVMFIGNYPNFDKEHAPIAMTYQNIWGLKPNPPSRRAVIGQSVFLPLLLEYPEDKTLTSLAAKSFFQVAYLNQLPDNLPGNRIARHFDLHSLMGTEFESR